MALMTMEAGRRRDESYHEGCSKLQVFCIIIQDLWFVQDPTKVSSLRFTLLEGLCQKAKPMLIKARKDLGFTLFFLSLIALLCKFWSASYMTMFKKCNKVGLKGHIFDNSPLINANISKVLAGKIPIHSRCDHYASHQTRHQFRCLLLLSLISCQINFLKN